MGGYYTYIYFDPRTTPPTPIYVGKGHGGRDRHHLRETHNPFLRAKIRKIKQAGLMPLVVRAEEGMSSDEASASEQALILKYGRADLGTGTLCNFTAGGEGTVGFRHRPETKLLFSMQRKGKPQTPAQHSANCSRPPQTEVTRAKRSAANKGHRRHTPEQIEAIRESNRTRGVSEETRSLWSRQRKGKVQSAAHIAKVVAAKRENEARRQASMTPEEWTAYKDRGPSKVRGQKRSEETKAKMRAAWERRRNARSSE